MKATVSKYLNARLGIANVHAPNPFYHVPGEEVEIVKSVIGQEIEGNSIWFVSAEGIYYWSGGFYETEISFFSKDSEWESLGNEEQMYVARQALIHYATEFKNKMGDGYSGMAVGYKYTSDHQKSFICLVVFVEKKGGNILYKIPAVLLYRGYSVPTDVQERQKATAYNYPGAGIKRAGSQFAGTATIKLRDRNFSYVLSCYHVLADKELSNGIYSFSLPDDLDPEDPAIIFPATNKESGFCFKGMFSDMLDYAIASLFNGSSFDNLSFNKLIEMVDSSLLNRQVSCDCRNTTLTGRIANISAAPLLYYDALQDSVQLFNLIEIHEMTTQHGDSGAPLYFSADGSKLLAGMIIGGFGSVSYAIPITTIISHANINL